MIGRVDTSQAAASAGRWRVEPVVGSPGDVHGKLVESETPASVWLVEATRSAVVVGSTQDITVVDPVPAAACGYDVVRRRSGGGAVLVVPGDLVWIDVIVPRGDPLWDDDVGRATHWLGEVWAEVVRWFGMDASVHTGGMIGDELSRLVCFAGVGPGEVLVDGAKVVGISQRRTRTTARFQSACLLRWTPAALEHVLRGLAAPGAETWRSRLLTAGVGVDVDGDAVVARFLEAIGHR